LTTPDTPAERVAALRKAFDATMTDAAFLAETRQLGLEMQPISAEAVTAIVLATINAPSDVVVKAKAAIGPSP